MKSSPLFCLAFACWFGIVPPKQGWCEQTSNTTKIGSFTFNVAEGLEFERVADPSLIQWPIAATRDQAGDLLVLECHWTKESVKNQLDSRPHKIVRLTDANRDGTFDKRIVIAEGLGFPEGIMQLGDDLLVTTPPQIIKLSDKDRDGFLESHEVWFDGKTLTHCANDLHGPMMGPDGWVYWTKGAFDEQDHELISRDDRPDMQHRPSKASHIYRRHPSGGPIERLMTGGMDNPSDLTFSPEGEIFFCSTFLHNPGNGLRDGIAHSPRGGLFGKRHQVIEGHWTTGPLLEPIANLGAAAPGGIHYLTSNRIPSATRWYPSTSEQNTNRFLVSAQFNLQKVGLHQLVPDGSSFKTETHDLISADRIDFHPVDILEEPDGSLLVLDTGGWYDLCCPSSGSDQSIAMGGIYRIKIPNKNTGALPPSQFVQLDRQRQLWDWARDLTKDPTRKADKQSVIASLKDSDPSVQQTASHIVALNQWKDAVLPLEELLASRSPSAVRAAIEALGVVGGRTSIPRLLHAEQRFPGDRMIRHSVIYALMEIGDTEELIHFATETQQDSQRFLVLYALDQLKALPDSLLPVLTKSLTSSNDNLREIALRCLSTRPQGIALCIPRIEKAWAEDDFAGLMALLPVVQQGVGNVDIRQKVSGWLQTSKTLGLEKQTWLLQCIQGLGDKPVPTEWTIPLTQWIDKADESMLVDLSKAVQSVVLTEDQKPLLATALRGRAVSLLSESVRENQSNPKQETALALLSASPRISDVLAEPCAQLIVKQIVTPMSQNASQADRALSRCRITRNAASLIVDALDQIPPIYLQTALEAILLCNDRDLDESLFKVLPGTPAAKTLSRERVLASLGNRSELDKARWASMIEKATEAPADVAENLDAWLKRLPAGDAVRGYQVFRNAKTACSSCHQVGYIGGKLGPELSHIGKSRTRRDLIEAVVFPSVRLAQGYYPTRIRTGDGEVYNGLLAKQTDAYVELLCGADKLCRIERADIEEQADSKISVMPNGLDQQMTLEEFADLLAFLESKR